MYHNLNSILKCVFYLFQPFYIITISNLAEISLILITFLQIDWIKKIFIVSHRFLNIFIDYLHVTCLSLKTKLIIRVSLP